MILRRTILCLFCCVLAGSAIVAQETNEAPFEDRVLPALFNEKIQSELDLVDEQKSQLAVLLNLLKSKRDTSIKALKQLEQEGASKDEIQAKREQLIAQLEFEKAETKSEVMEILLPHQQQRLRQVTNQFMLREIAKSEKVPSGVLAPLMRKYLEIDDAQANRLQEKAAALKKGLDEKIKKLTEEAQQELLKELNSEQRAKFEKLTGEPIEKLEK